MNTLLGLCKPGPHDVKGRVPWEPVRDKMLDLYGAAVDHPDFYQAFRVVMDAGGHDSPHMADLQAFTRVYVNPKLRKLRFEAYGVIAAYPWKPEGQERFPEMGLEAEALEGVVSTASLDLAEI